MNSKLFGGILLVVGTTIGAGMLALPVATAQLGFWGSLFLLIGCWAVMAVTAFLFLEVNLWLPPNTNLVSMAGATLGRSGQAITWVVYLVLLYSIICSYVAGGGDLFHYVLAKYGVVIPQTAASILFTTLFGIVVYMGIRSVDYVNRFLMFGKMGALFLLICLILPFISRTNLDSGEFMHVLTRPSSLNTTAVAFGCLMIIPSLRTYFDKDIKTLRKAIFIGMFIPLICYILWDMVIMGVIPLDGVIGLKSMDGANNTNSALVSALATMLQKNNITRIFEFFTSICMATSFLGVSLSLSDFLSDGLKIKKQGVLGNAFILGATFLPPVVVVLFYPNAFSLGLNFAGICILILMVLLPPLMLWAGRYHRNFQSLEYQSKANKSILIFLMLFAVFLLVLSGKYGIVSLGILSLVFAAGYFLSRKPKPALATE